MAPASAGIAFGQRQGIFGWDAGERSWRRTGVSDFVDAVVVDVPARVWVPAVRRNPRCGSPETCRPIAPGTDRPPRRHPPARARRFSWRGAPLHRRRQMRVAARRTMAGAKKARDDMAGCSRGPAAGPFPACSAELKRLSTLEHPQFAGNLPEFPRFFPPPTHPHVFPRPHRRPLPPEPHPDRCRLPPGLGHRAGVQLGRDQVAGAVHHGLPRRGPGPGGSHLDRGEHGRLPLRPAARRRWPCRRTIRSMPSTRPA